MAGRYGHEGCAALQVEQLLVGLDRLGAGRDAQLALQCRDAGVIDAQRGRAVAVDRVEAHEVAVGGFMQGVVAQQALGVVDGAAVVAALLEQQDQLLQRVEEAFRQPGAFEQQPVVVAARQQVAAVGRDRAFQRSQARAALGTGGFGQRSLELGDIQRKRRIPAPAHGLVGDFQEASSDRGSRWRSAWRSCRRLVCAWASVVSGQKRKASCWRDCGRRDAGAGRRAAPASAPCARR